MSSSRIRTPASERACDGLIALYAGWTLVSHAVVFAQGSLRQLAWAAGGAAIAVGIGALGLRRVPTWRGWLRRGAAEPGGADAREIAPGPIAGIDVAIAFAITAIAAASLKGDLRLPWVLALGTLSIALARTWTRDSPRAPHAWSDPRAERALWLSAAVCALVPLFFHRRSLDDAYYVNVPTAAVDEPDAPLLLLDTLHGIPGLPILLPIYKVHSFETLQAALSWLLDLPTIAVAQLLLPALLAPFVPLAWARLMRLLMPRAWIAGFAAALAVLLAIAENTEFWGNFALLRLQQGKCAFLAIVVPLLLVYGYRFAERPTVGRWLLLFAAQVAAAGMTSTAIWVAPLVTLAGVAGGLPLRVASARTLAAAAASAFYVVALGLLLRESSTAAVQGFGESPAPERLLREMIAYMIGSGPVAFACGVATLGAWSLAPSGPGRRISVVLALGFLLLLNPFFPLFVAEHVTGVPTYYRVFWLLPMPAWFALLLCAPLLLAEALALPRNVALGACAALAAAFLALAPALHLFERDNFVRFEPLGLAVPPEEFAAARALAAAASRRGFVLAPESVGMWVVTQNGYPHPLVPRLHYLSIQRSLVEPAEWNRRTALTLYMDGRWHGDGAPQLLADAIARYPLQAVALERRVAWAEEIRGVLAAQGLAPAWASERFEVWKRSGAVDSPGRPGGEGAKRP
jgi:hypothetical protein